MVRITKLTDYGVLVMTLMADLAPDERVSARDLSVETSLPQPTVGKILGILTRAGLLTSSRGALGGYQLARHPAEISVVDVITAFEGPIALTDCLSPDGPGCEVEPVCPTRANWDRINEAIRTALREIPLAEMARPQRGWRERMSASLSAPMEGSGNE